MQNERLMGLSFLFKCSTTLRLFIPSPFNKYKTKHPTLRQIKYLLYLKAWESADLQALKKLYLFVCDGGCLFAVKMFHISKNSPKMKEICFYFM
jgi:hypothetical protein